MTVSNPPPTELQGSKGGDAFYKWRLYSTKLRLYWSRLPVGQLTAKSGEIREVEGLLMTLSQPPPLEFEAG
jgi:hypothetical protein